MNQGKYLSVVMIVAIVGLLSACGQKKQVSVVSEEALDNAVTYVAEDGTEIAQGQQEEWSQTSDETAKTSSEQTIASSQTATSTTIDAGAFIKPTVQEIQTALQNVGLYQGKIDGSLGPKTKKAIREFQEQNSLKADGKVGPQTWGKLASYLSQQAMGTAPVEVSN